MEIQDFLVNAPDRYGGEGLEIVYMNAKSTLNNPRQKNNNNGPPQRFEVPPKKRQQQRTPKRGYLSYPGSAPSDKRTQGRNIPFGGTPHFEHNLREFV